MNAPAAFSATFADWKLIKTRKCVQIVFEVPLEAADAAYQVLGGMPDPSTSVWFGIAKLQPTTTGGRGHEVAETAPRQQTANRAGGARKWDELPYSQQAALSCDDKVFWAFLREELGYEVMNIYAAAVAVRMFCEVTSRSELDTGGMAARKWAEMWQRYGAWKLADRVSA
jgi:hypothetical protein